MTRSILREREAEESAAELRELLQANGLLADLPAELELTDAQFETVYRRAVTGAAVGVIEPRAPRSLPARYVLAACLALAVAIPVGARHRTTTEPAPIAEQISAPALGGFAPLTFTGGDLANVSTAPQAADEIVSVINAAVTSIPVARGEVQFIAKIESLRESGLEEDGQQFHQIGLRRVDTWIAPDGSGQISETTGSQVVDVSRGSELDATAIYGEEQCWQYPVGHFNSKIVARLPRDPAQLRLALIDYACGDVSAAGQSEQDRCMISAVPFFYNQYVIPGDLAAAFWATISESPELRSLGDTTDRLGRPAAAFAMLEGEDRDGASVLVLLVSPDTGRLIGTEEVDLYNQFLGITEPTVVTITLFVDAKHVAAIGDTTGTEPEPSALVTT